MSSSKSSAAISDKVELLGLLEEKYRRRAATDLNHFCQYITIPGAPVNPEVDDCETFYPEKHTPAEHHRLLNDALMRVFHGEIKNLMVFMPPGSAKSTYGSVTFPSFYLGNRPKHNIIGTSYGTTLAQKMARKVRQICLSPEYGELFGTNLKENNRAVLDWALQNEATYMGGGILSGITGNRADGLIIDDPVKGHEDADSQVMRDKTWDAYLSDLETRLKPTGWQIIIQTRWHEDDLSGRILPDTYDGESGWIRGKDGRDWYVICLQAQCEHESDPLGREIGEWLWTDWFTPEFWVQKKRTQGERNWSALYQQRPKPAEGSLIKRSWPRRYKTAPAAFSRIVLSLDTAYKPEQVNDPSVIGVWGELKAGRYLLDVWRDRVEYPELKRVLANVYEKTASRWKRPDAILIEDKASGQSLIQELRANTSLPVIAIDTGGQSKLVRLVEVSPQFESGIVWLPESAPWLIDYESELFGFPLATHDDQVDMTSQYLKWSHSALGEIFVDASGNIRAGYAQDVEEGDFYDDSGDFDGGRNDFGGFI